MQTSLDCLVCFMRQALSTARVCSEDPDVQRLVVIEAGKFLSTMDFNLSSPENAVGLYALIAELTGEIDPYAGIKSRSNEFALGIQEETADAIEAASDPLLAAVRFAIGGNIIDYGAPHSFDAAETLAVCQQQEFAIDHYAAFRSHIEATRPGTKILYLADNCGELVFDGLLVRQLQKLDCEVTVAVREHTIINDATYQDAETCGLVSLCKVITNGTGCPGTPLASCSREFLDYFHGADLILSKGMGNFETLSEVAAPIYFLFTVKCSQVATHLTKRNSLAHGLLAGKGEMVLLQQENT
ncbi:MAG: DUF89 family protein [Desulfobulbaceae bacterium]|nr:DUF89 family protein [Desulfobulbaceae bacterium]